MSKNRLKNNNIKTSSRPPTNPSSSTSTTITSTSNNKNNSTGNNSVGPVPTLKVVLLGDLGVGKTCLRSQFVHHVFTNAYKATIGGDYLTTTILLLQDTDPQEEQDQPPSSSNGDTTNSNDPLLDTKLKEASPKKKKSKKPKITKANLQIWDTAGQERFNSISQAFYRGTDICILVYDVTNYESVLSIRDWFSRFMEHCHVEFPGVVIVGNKSDKVNDRCVDLDEIKDIVTSNTTVANVGDYIDDWDNCLCEVSAKKLEVVNDLFKRVAKVGVDLLYGYDDDDDDDENPVKRRRLQQFDKIDLRETHNRINEQNSATSSSCAC